MEIGVPREIGRDECRVALTPRGVERLIAAGHRVHIQRGAGDASGFSDDAYHAAGAGIAFSRDETLRRSRLIAAIAPPAPDDLRRCEPGTVVTAFWHLAAAPRDLLRAVLETRVTALAYELVQDSDGSRPVLRVMSRIGGSLAVLIGATLLGRQHGGAGVLLGGLPGVAPGEVVILGAGAAGEAAARTAVGIGANVTVLDTDPARLEALDRHYDGRVVTLDANPANVAKAVAFANLLIAAVAVPGARAPRLVSREQVAAMRPRSVIVDLAIDQGGAVETSRPRSLSDPTFVAEGVLHYCVPNLPSAVSRTATQGLEMVMMPHLLTLAQARSRLGVDPALAPAVCAHNGRLTHPEVARAWELPHVPVERALETQ